MQVLFSGFRKASSRKQMLPFFACKSKNYCSEIKAGRVKRRTALKVKEFLDLILWHPTSKCLSVNTYCDRKAPILNLKFLQCSKQQVPKDAWSASMWWRPALVIFSFLHPAPSALHCQCNYCKQESSNSEMHPALNSLCSALPFVSLWSGFRWRAAGSRKKPLRAVPPIKKAQAHFSWWQMVNKMKGEK